MSKRAQQRRKQAERAHDQGPVVRHLKGVCQRCLYWETQTELPLPRIGKGVCRRYPPILVPNSAGGCTALWPVTGCDEWCGEFKDSPR